MVFAKKCKIHKFILHLKKLKTIRRIDLRQQISDLVGVFRVEDVPQGPRLVTLVRNSGHSWLTTPGSLHAFDGR